MKLELFSILRCPFCMASVQTGAVLQGSAEEIDFGILECPDCRFEYPVIAGIPIIRHADARMDLKAETTADTVFPGPRVGDLVRTLRAEKKLEALAMLLAPSGDRGRLFPSLKRTKESHQDSVRLGSSHLEVGGREFRFKRGGRLLRKARHLYRKATLPRAQLRLAAYLEQNARNLTALEVLDIYYRQFSGVETYNYFSFRFGQPRHLAGLDLASMLAQKEGPILDVACGLGHVTHYFASSRPNGLVVGIDRDYFRLFVASRYVAPSANYVCGPADEALPFTSEAFCGVYCSDAFHYFLHRASSVQELLRLLGSQGILVLSRFGNRDAEPREGYELTVDGYRRLLGTVPHVVLGEDDLIECYLQKKGPLLSEEAPSDRLGQQKWLSIVAARDRRLFDEHHEFVEWPHAVGRLRLNPIYRAAGGLQHGDLELHFKFPSKWYEFENNRYLEYAPEHCRIDAEAIRSLRLNERSAELERYIKSFVVIGTPESYC